jgi:hypothetical protein
MITRRYILVHTHPENLVIGPLAARQFAALPLTLAPPIESPLYSLQANLFTDSALVAALEDPSVEVVCLCLRTRDRYGEARKLGMTVIEVKDFNEAYNYAQDRVPREERYEVPADPPATAYTAVSTRWEARTEDMKK